MPVDLDLAGPVNDNRATLASRDKQKGPKGSKDGRVLAKGESMPHRMSNVPQASSMLGHMNIINDAGGRGTGRAHGIPGIITSTSLGPEQRTRLISGIIDLAESGHHDMEGPLHSVMGSDATAMNAGMRPIPGAVIRADHKGGRRNKKYEDSDSE